MGVSLKEFAFRNMFCLGNAFWVLISSCAVCILWTLFAKVSWVSNERSQVSGVGADEVGENSDDRNGATGETLGSDSGLQSVCKEENSSDSLSVSNAITSKYEFLSGNSFCGYIEEPQNTSFRVQELFLDSAFERRITDGSVITENSVCRESQELDDQRKTGDSVGEEVDGQGKSERIVCTDTSLDKGFRESDNRAKTVAFVCSEPSVEKDFREVDDQVKTKVLGTDEVKTDVSICSNELFAGEDYRHVDDQEKTESSNGVSGYDEGEESEVLTPLQEKLIPEELSEKADFAGFCNEFQLPWEDQLLSSDHVNQEPSRLSNDFWHTNGEFISGFDEVYCHQHFDNSKPHRTQK